MNVPDSGHRFSQSIPCDPTGMPIQEFVGLCAYLNGEEFTRRYQHPFLLQVSQDFGQRKVHGFGTISSNIDKIPVDSDLKSNRVLFVVKRAANAFSMMVTVGRAENNDILIRNGKVSKFHAYFNQTGGSWSLTDANSSNGSFAGPERMLPNTRYPLQDHSEVSFSSELVYRFMLPKSMYHHVQVLNRDR